MSELEQLSYYIKNILGNDNKLRKESEDIINGVKEKNMDQYFLLLLQLLRVSNDTQIRSFCAVMLRKQLSAFSERNFSPCWKKIGSQTAKHLKGEVFLALRDEPSKLVRYQICDLIGELGGTILNLEDEDAQSLSDEHKTWDELIKHIMELWLSKIDTMLKSAFKIMTTLFNYVSDDFLKYKNDFYTMFRAGMEYTSLEIKTSAIEAMCSWLEIIDSKYCRMYEELIPLFMETVLFVLSKDEDKGVDCLGCIIDVAESEPRFFRKNFAYLFKTMQKICSVKEVEEDGIKQMAVQALISVLERIPKIYKDNHAYLKDLLEMTFAYMIETTEEITPEWMNPKEGFLEEIIDESDNAGVKFGSQVIDRMIAIIGQEVMLPMLSNLVQQMMASSDWRFKFSALMSLSQVGEYVKNVDDIAPIVGLVLKFLGDSHAKIRYAACHVLGQIADDCQPEFQAKFHQDLIPTLLNKLNESSPRVLSHVLAALTNVLEGLPTDLTKNYIETVLNSVFPFTQQGISLVRENALSTISAIAESARHLYQPYFEKSVPIIYEIMKTHNQPEYKQLRGQCIECITVMGTSVGKDYFKKFASDIIELLVQIQKNDVAMDSMDPQKCYILSGWQRICLILEDEFVPFLQLIIPSLFKVVENVLKGPQQKKTEEVPSKTILDLANEKTTSLDQMREHEKKNANTFEHEEVEIAIKMIFVFVTELKKYYVDYVEATVELVLRALNYLHSDKIRKQAAKCLPALLEVINDSDHHGKAEIMVRLAKAFIEALWTALSSEFEPETIKEMITAIKECINITGKFMNSAEIEGISARILKVLSESDLRKSENEKYKVEGECEQEEIEVLDDDNDLEEDLHVALAELIGILFKTHKELTLPLVKILYTEVLAKVLQPGLSDKMHKFGIFLIDDMIEHLGIELIPNEWPGLSEAILKYATDKTCFVRQAALYGIGVLAMKSKDAFNSIAELCLMKILEALKIPKGDESDRMYGFSRDNAIAALGKIIQNGSAKLNVELIIPEWINQLPLQYDKPDGRKQHEFLCDMILTWNAALVFGPNGERLPQVLKIFGTIIDSKFANPSIEEKIGKILRALASEDKTKALLENAFQWKELTMLMKQRLEKVLMKVSQ